MFTARQRGTEKTENNEKTLLVQRVKEVNDATVIDCEIVMHAPQRGHLRFNPRPSQHIPDVVTQPVMQQDNLTIVGQGKT